MQYELDLEGRFVLFYRRSFTAEQIAENRIVTSVHPSTTCARDSDPGWVFIQGTLPVGRYLCRLSPR
jgi:hypothetical protein